MNHKIPIVGILAGMGPRSTGPFLDLVVTACQQIYGARHDIDFPKMLICSQPAPFYEDRAIDHQALRSAITEGLQDLERSGADFLAIACNTAHVYFPQLVCAVNVPLLNIVELSVAAVPSDCRSVALLAAKPTVDSGIYQTELTAAGFRVLDVSWQTETDNMLSLVRETQVADVFVDHWSRLLGRIAEARADVVLLACLDLSGVFRFAKTTTPVVDAANCLAHAIVREWLHRQERDPGASNATS